MQIPKRIFIYYLIYYSFEIINIISLKLQILLNLSYSLFNNILVLWKIMKIFFLKLKVIINSFNFYIFLLLFIIHIYLKYFYFISKLPHEIKY